MFKTFPGRIFFSIIFLSFPYLLLCQDSIEGVVNFYEKAIGYNPACNELDLSRSSDFNEGNLVMVIQMSGAVINESNSENFGSILDYRSTGLFEFARVASNKGSSIQLNESLRNDYQYEYRVQVVFIPEFPSGTILGNITCPPWDGELGGVIAIMSDGELELQGTISASGRGFRGGGMVEFVSTNANRCKETDYVASFDDNVGSQKGEGVAQFIVNNDYGRGKQGNGGGGGNIHNAGGGGGSNYGAGGKGGKEWVRCGTPILEIGGDGGQPLSYTEKNRLFLGGGGGGGNENDGGGTIGADGGGIIIIKAKAINSINGRIEANGADQIELGVLDSGGGGGGGGSILINSDLIDGQLTIEAQGGFGGRINEPTVSSNYVWGPGGGGGGGVVGLSEGLELEDININLEGGEQGYYICCEQWTWDAKPGEDGGLIDGFIITPPTSLKIDSVTICEGGFYDFWGEQITEEGLYHTTLVSDSGCDSLASVHLKIGEIFTETQTFSFCEGYDITIRGKTYNTPGVYVVPVPGIDECDTVLTLNINSISGYEIDLSETICEGDTFSFNNTAFTETGIYDAAFLSREGCDSTVTLYLTVIERQAVEEFYLSTCGDLEFDTSLDCTGNAIWYTGTDSLSWEPPNDLLIIDIYNDTVFISECYENGCLYYSANYNISYDSSKVESILDLDQEYFMCERPEIELFLSGFEFYNWNNTSAENYFITDIADEYFVSVIDSNNCIQRHLFRVFPCLDENRFVPNIFTPNGDGINDDFRMYGAYADNYNMKIFDRWGNLIFEAYDFLTGWDGTRNGQILNPGVYIYSIEFDQPFLNLNEIKTKRKALAGEVILYR